MIFALEVYQDI